ncbi:MAG: acetyltransferase [Myxococcaceae bacterium]|nr:acetyltransferase [Myxococcaceae bacterium]
MIDLTARPRLRGERISLEALDDALVDGLVAAFDPATWPSIWRWYSVEIADAGALRRFLDGLRREESAGVALPYAVRDLASGALIGASSYLHVEPAHRRVEIGATWYAPEWQRTYANTEAKRLMLTQAFEGWQCLCVQIQTDALNERSRRAIERLGARLDGVLRAHRVCADGRVRDSAVYSILRDEWPAVRGRLRPR